MASTSAGQGRAGTAITAINSDIIETHILNRTDGPTLASAACTSRHLHALSMKEKVWREICNSTWTSTKHPRVRDTISTFPGGHRSFVSDSFPILCPRHHRSRYRPHRSPVQTSELISAVDIHYKAKLVYSKVEVTNTGTDSFLSSTFRVDLLDREEPVRVPVKFEGDECIYMSNLEEYMTLSCIVIDPTLMRAANVSSLRPVSVRPHWVGGDIQVKYATIVAGDCRGGMSELVECRIVVMLGWTERGELQLREVNLQVLDMDRKCLRGKDSLGILQEAMVSEKRKKGKRGEEKETYSKFVDMKRERKDGKERRERQFDMIFTVMRAIIFLGLIFLIFGCLLC